MPENAYLGEIILFAGNFAPRGWAMCHGQLLPIATHSALFSILGTLYGGDGRTTFALPDLRGRAPIGAGEGRGLTRRQLGQAFGSEGSSGPASPVVTNGTKVTLQEPEGTYVGAPPGKGGKTSGTPELTVGLVSGEAQASAGGGGLPPSLPMNYIICVEGAYPSRS